MRQYPIYNRISANGRKSSADFGARDWFTQNILVGTSSKNSHQFAHIEVTRTVDDDGKVIFNLWVDDELVKQGILADKSLDIRWLT